MNVTFVSSFFGSAYSATVTGARQIARLPGISHSLSGMGYVLKGYSVYSTGMLLYQGHVNLHALPTRRHGTDLFSSLHIHRHGTDYRAHHCNSEGFAVWSNRLMEVGENCHLEKPMKSQLLQSFQKRFAGRGFSLGQGDSFPLSFISVFLSPVVRCHYAKEDIFVPDGSFADTVEHSNGKDLPAWTFGPVGAAVESVRCIHELPKRWMQRPGDVVLGALQFTAGLALLNRYVGTPLGSLQVWLDRSWTGSAVRYALHLTTF